MPPYKNLFKDNLIPQMVVSAHPCAHDISVIHARQRKEKTKIQSAKNAKHAKVYKQ
jgi:hypothetical protein